MDMENSWELCTEAKRLHRRRRPWELVSWRKWRSDGPRNHAAAYHAATLKPHASADSTDSTGTNTLKPKERLLTPRLNYIERICYLVYPLSPKKMRKTGQNGQVGAKMCQVPWMFSAPFHDHVVDSWSGDLICQGLAGKPVRLSTLVASRMPSRYQTWNRRNWNKYIYTLYVYI